MNGRTLNNRRRVRREFRIAQAMGKLVSAMGAGMLSCDLARVRCDRSLERRWNEKAAAWYRGDNIMRGLAPGWAPVQRPLS